MLWAVDGRGHVVRRRGPGRRRNSSFLCGCAKVPLTLSHSSLLSRQSGNRVTLFAGLTVPPVGPPMPPRPPETATNLKHPLRAARHHPPPPNLKDEVSTPSFQGIKARDASQQRAPLLAGLGSSLGWGRAPPAYFRAAAGVGFVVPAHLLSESTDWPSGAGVQVCCYAGRQCTAALAVSWCRI